MYLNLFQDGKGDQNNNNVGQKPTRAQGGKTEIKPSWADITSGKAKTQPVTQQNVSTFADFIPKKIIS